MYFNFDNIVSVYIKDVMEECTDKNGKWKSLILLIPVRLGAEKFNSIYAPCLTTLFSLKQCIGIIGGRPKHSLYFVGYQGLCLHSLIKRLIYIYNCR